MRHFDTTDPEHLALLPKEFRKADELDRLADEAEADVVSRYTELGDGGAGAEVAEGVHVRLRGYDADPAAIDPTLALALRREIVSLILWRHGRERVNLLVQTDAKADKSTTLSQKAYEPFPPGFGRWLRPFDVRVRNAVWSI